MAGLLDRIEQERLRCKQAETTRDCQHNHIWRDGRAYHFESAVRPVRFPARDLTGRVTL